MRLSQLNSNGQLIKPIAWQNCAKIHVAATKKIGAVLNAAKCC